MTMLAKRSYQKEIIDLDLTHYSVEEYYDCLEKLNRVGKWLGGDGASFAALRRLQEITSILDVGCGSGYFTIAMGMQFPDAQIVGIDINPLAIEFANNLLSKMANPPPNVSFVLKTKAELDAPPKSYDVVISTLVCHHLDDPALIDFIERAYRVAKRKVIINDLHRHPIAYWSFWMIAPLIFRNRLVMHDGPISVKRAFSKRDWHVYLNKASLTPKEYTISWHWAFRWLIEIDCQKDNKC